MRGRAGRWSVSVAVTALLALALGAGPLRAGSGNIIHVLQESLPGAVVGNSLTIDQSNADGSIVLGPSQELRNQLSTFDVEENGNVLIPFESQRNVGVIAPATQRGEGNTASITMSGVGGEVQFYQDNSGQVGLLTGNLATVNVVGAGVGAVLQVGDGNTANLSLQGNLATGLISQNGTSLTADLSVGAGGIGQVIQIGSRSSTGPVTVAPNTSLTYTQVGNNLAPAFGVAGVQVMTTMNAGTITITQTGF